MKKRWKATAIIVTAVVLILAVAGVVLAQGSWWNDSPSVGVARGQGNGALQRSARTGTTGDPAAAGSHSTLTAPSGIALSQDEKDALVFLREEEKLARDVYSALYAEWGSNAFSNIASSEVRHMDGVKILLDACGVSDPVTDDTPGVFVNTELQAAYDSLVPQGSQSLEEAFKVGMTIENLDIEDLESLTSVFS